MALRVLRGGSSLRGGAGGRPGGTCCHMLVVALGACRSAKDPGGKHPGGGHPGQTRPPARLLPRLKAVEYGGGFHDVLWVPRLLLACTFFSSPSVGLGSHGCAPRAPWRATW
eukprot:CAMPEP_0202876408 /NCGR_PEP_ID=MMETSP1391-20130828/28936_1 /ASSEMBLY_ACC=CAM_ASM_000867 /TAXON_ID=1034604 /ORGANISM="Chlamydomonas leiostraca, Strain SAG 11-49" /LENGTH=111 /DNA_ID=CAMNT_0049558243 /DNA_START=484 /DNA_END=820 /DNA_ORIENTATION=-